MPIRCCPCGARRPAVRGRQLRPAAALGRRGPHLADRETPAGDRHLNAIVGDGNLLVAGESGTLLRSTDNGATWDKLPSPYAGSLFGALMLANGDWVAYGMRGNVVRSTDRGAPGRTSTATCRCRTSARPSSPTANWCWWQGGAIVASRDGGLTFDVRKLGGVQSLAAVLDMGHGALLLGGEAGVAPLAGAAASTPS